MHNRSLADPIAIQQLVYDDEKNANRVYVINAIPGQATSTTLDQKIVEKQVIVKEIEYKILEVPKIVIEKQFQIEKIEVPIYIEKIVEKFIEKPIYITEYKTIEVPLITKEIQFIDKPVHSTDLPKWLVVVLGLQTTITLILAILNFKR